MDKIYNYNEVYSKKKGTVIKRYKLEEGLTLEAALQLSFEKYGNINKQLEWFTKGPLYPTQYLIKK